MTCPFASIVKATAPTVGAHTEKIVHDFYPRMFKNNPETKAFFNPANQFAEPPTQRMALANAIVAYATNIEDLTPLTSAVQIIANKHCGLQVKAEHYPIVDENLAAAVLEVLGEDVVTPEIGGAWREAVQALAKILIDTELGLTEEAANRSGGWRGVKDFRITGIRDVTETCREFTFEAADADKTAIDFAAGQPPPSLFRYERSREKFSAVLRQEDSRRCGVQCSALPEGGRRGSSCTSVRCVQDE